MNGLVLAFHDARELDITERKQAEAVLRESEERLRLTLEAGSMGSFEVDTRTGESVWSDVQFELLGLTPGEVRPCPESFFRVVHPNDVGRLVEQWEAAKRSGKLDTDFRIVRADGPVRWLAAKGSFILDEAGKRADPDAWKPFRFRGVTFDITERKEVEARLRESDRRKDEFLATLAHELRNPLAAIRNGFQLTQLGADDPDTVELGRSIMDRQLTQMVRLVDDLMDISRISRGKIELRKEQVSLESVVNNAVETSRPVIEQMGHELIIALPKQPVVIEADLARLAQALMNLLTNAAKYTERGGRIWLTAERQGSDVVVSVKDTGIGIAADQIPRLFEMFSQLDHGSARSQGGLGVGLTLVKQLVQMHGGSVEAKSEGQGKGSEFIVRLPVVVEMPVLAPMRKGGISTKRHPCESWSLTTTRTVLRARGSCSRSWATTFAQPTTVKRRWQRRRSSGPT